MLIRLRSGEPMGFAGLLEHSPDGTGTFTILTVPPNEMMREIHNRMPAIVWPRDYAHWLDPALMDVEKIHTMLTPYADEQMEAWPISTRVNSARNEGAELMEQVSGHGYPPPDNPDTYRRSTPNTDRRTIPIAIACGPQNLDSGLKNAKAQPWCLG